MIPSQRVCVGAQLDVPPIATPQRKHERGVAIKPSTFVSRDKSLHHDFAFRFHALPFYISFFHFSFFFFFFLSTSRSFH